MLSFFSTININFRNQQTATATLSQLNVWRVAAFPGGLPAWELCPTFKKNLKIALLGAGRPQFLTVIQNQEIPPFSTITRCRGGGVCFITWSALELQSVQKAKA